jgi:GDPmannose 4,6-dehydratase
LLLSWFHDQYPLRLGNLTAKRGWGSAKEYVDGMWRILRAPSPEAFVLATGRTETIRKFVNKAYATQGIELEWEGAGTDERALCRKTGKTLVAVDKAYYRPSEVQALVGDATKAAKKLGWVPHRGLEAIIEEMVRHRSSASDSDAPDGVSVGNTAFSAIAATGCRQRRAGPGSQNVDLDD